MVRDGVANIVDRLQECGFDPRKVGHDSWEARCPAHRSMDHALSITRNEFNHVVLECRSTRELPVYSDHPGARFYERSCVRRDPRLVDQPVEPRCKSSRHRRRAPSDEDNDEAGLSSAETASKPLRLEQSWKRMRSPRAMRRECCASSVACDGRRRRRWLGQARRGGPAIRAPAPADASARASARPDRAPPPTSSMRGR